MRVLRAIFPHPVLTVLLTLVWLLLVNRFSLNSLLFGLILGTVLPWLTSTYWPDAPRLRHPLRVAEYVVVVLWDIVMANIAVARLILLRPDHSRRPGWVSVPVDLTDTTAIAVLANTITMTPGTVSADLTRDHSAILVHFLDAPDPESVRDEIKERYERRLKEIFE